MAENTPSTNGNNANSIHHLTSDVPHLLNQSFLPPDLPENTINLFLKSHPPWFAEFSDFPLPKLGDFPDDPSFQELALHYYESWLHYAAEDPSTWRYDTKNFTKLVDFLTIPNRENKAAKYFRHGFEVQSPATNNDYKAFDCKSDSIKKNCLHLSDLLNDNVQGKIAGPSRLNSEMKHVTI